MAVPCPDPSAHTATSKLQEQASTAALLAASPSRKQKPAGNVVDKDGRLSSRSAAMSLKQARPEDLPSYPSTGGVTTNHSSNAASLAHGNQKPFEHWKPDASSAAGKAALLAKDYKPAPMWQPNASAAGSKAALLAHRDGPKLNLWSPEASPHGNTAASHAFRNSTAGTSIPQSPTADTRHKALLAASKSVTRARSGSAPALPPPNYPDAINSAHNALNAATVANRPATSSRGDDVIGSPALEESRIRHLSDKISREMWTDHPPLESDLEEKRHQDALRASAVSMAKGMYSLAQRSSMDHTSTAGATAASAAAERNSIAAQPDLKQQAMQYIHLQEAAHRLAGERLAKLDADSATKYREHYGYPTKSPRQKLSVRSKNRRRANSDGNFSDSDDERNARRVRTQMSLFSKELDAVDAKKRQTDRAALLAAAEKKVQAQMKGIDERVYAQTGKVSPAMMEIWEAKAREKATRDSAKRTENFGKADIGGGKFMDQSEIEAIAAARLKPTLDEITENAEKRRARDEELRLAAEERKFQEVKEKTRARDAKTAQKQAKQEEKAAAKQEKADAKAAAAEKKDAERTRKAEERRAKQEQRRSRDGKKDAAIGAAAFTGAAAGAAAGVGVPATEAAEHAHETAEPAIATTDQPRASASADPDDSDDDRVYEDAEDSQPVSPVLTRKPTGEAVFRPGIERAVTEIESSSESHDSSDLEEDADEGKVDETDKTRAGLIQRLFGRKDKPSHLATAPEVTEEQEKESDVHMGTDGAINKPPAEALDILHANKMTSEDKEPEPVHEVEGVHMGIDGPINKPADEAAEILESSNFRTSHKEPEPVHEVEGVHMGIDGPINKPADEAAEILESSNFKTSHKEPEPVHEVEGVHMGIDGPINKPADEAAEILESSNFKTSHKEAEPVHEVEGVHMGTDGPINKPAPEALGILEANHLASDESKEQYEPEEGVHVGTDGPINKPPPEALDILKANNAKSDAADASGKSPRRLSKLLTKLRRSSKPAPPENIAAAQAPSSSSKHVLTKSRNRRASSPQRPKTAPEPTPSATVAPTDPDHTAASAAENTAVVAEAEKEEEAAAAEEHKPGDESPSSFVRHGGRSKTRRSSVSSLSSDGPDVPAFKGLIQTSRSPVRDSRFQEEL